MAENIGQLAIDLFHRAANAVLSPPEEEQASDDERLTKEADSGIAD